MTTDQFFELFEHDSFKKKVESEFLKGNRRKRFISKWLTDNFITLINQDFENNELKFENIPGYIKYLEPFGLTDICEHLKNVKHKFRKQKLEKINALQHII